MHIISSLDVVVKNFLKKSGVDFPCRHKPIGCVSSSESIRQASDIFIFLIFLLTLTLRQALYSIVSGETEAVLSE